MRRGRTQSFERHNLIANIYTYHSYQSDPQMPFNTPNKIGKLAELTIMALRFSIGTSLEP